ncbi:MAG: hypothetical protein LQ341_001971 [Variospora aurantia]|nr:MAG: hypothetical protein LQ341_001971 [Variospora aurantia]
MGRIKKAAGPKHEATVSPVIAEYVAKAVALPVARLPAHLRTFPRWWPFPRGDLYHWIPLLNRFDTILDQFSREYGLQNGPQTAPFTCSLLRKGVADDGSSENTGAASEEELADLGFAPDGDKQLAQGILSFSCDLMESCGNRSLYSSSDRLGHLLNTTDLSLLASALQLAVRLAQRYHASRQRGTNASQHLNNALLASHYNIDLEKVQRLADPFPKSAHTPNADLRSATKVTPVVKGKEKIRSASQSQNSTSVQSSDLVAIASERPPEANGPADPKAAVSPDLDQALWAEWGSVQMKYYQPSSNSQENAKTTTPTTPTPGRRPSNLSRPSHLSSAEDSADLPSNTPASKTEESNQGGMKSLEISQTYISSTPILNILKDILPDLPKDSQYELLTRLRVAHAMTHSLTARQELLIVRILALTNLAYIYPDAIFQQKILQHDSDEPRRLQLAYQLAELLQPSGNGSSRIPLRLQMVAFGALEALTKHKSRTADVCAALNININHGVLLQTLKKAAADLAIEDSAEKGYEADREEWREALFSLLEALPSTAPKTGETLIAAGLFDILIEMLNLRTVKAERLHHKVLTFLNTIVNTMRDAFQTFANAKGLDTISDLVAFEVSDSMNRAKEGQGIPVEHRNQIIDYQIPYFQQQTIRWLFKFINHMMSHGGGNNDRLLRNLIDSPQLLGALKTVIVHSRVFGSSVWSGSVNILSSFIHNEPTSYGIIAEAGLSRGFLEAVSSESIIDPKDSKENGDTHATMDEGSNEAASGSTGTTPTPAKPSTSEKVVTESKTPRRYPLAQGILPATDAIVTVPQAFGAICLNNAGLNLFLRSPALDRFFEIFESPEHIKSMTTESELPRLLGSSFDELVRHYTELKDPVMQSIMLMIRRVYALCQSRADKEGLGAKLWVDDGQGKSRVAGGKWGLQNGDLRKQDSDVIMDDSGVVSEVQPVKSNLDRELANTKSDEQTSDYIGIAMKFLGGFFENTTVCSAFAHAGGVSAVLDFASLSSLQYDFNNGPASHEIARVIHMLVEQKPHLVMPSLLDRTQAAIDVLEPLSNNEDGLAYFAKYTTPDQTVPEALDDSPYNGTRIVKHLVFTHTFCNILSEVFSSPIFNTRSSHTIFTQVNLTDMYVKLVKSLGKLHRACVWEDILLQNALPDAWKEATKVKGYGLGSREADDIFGVISQDEASIEADEASQGGATNDAGSGEGTTITSGTPSSQKRRQSLASKDEDLPQFQNVRALRYLLSQIPASITPFLQGLGKALIAKRRPDTYARQSAYMVADAMSGAILEQLRFAGPKDSASVKDQQSYWIVILTSLGQLLIEGPVDLPSPQCLTLVLQAFKNAGGLTEIKSLLELFVNEAKSQFTNTSKTDSIEGTIRLATACGGIRMILNLYSGITSSKMVVESSQTSSLQSNERDRGTPYYFHPPQLLVELRMAVLPVVRSIWDSDFVDKAPTPIVKGLIEILRTGLESNEEQGAYKRGDRLPVRAKPTFKIYNLPEDRVSTLTDQGFDAALVREALYRCYNGQRFAEEYCEARRDHQLPRYPIPDYDQERKKDPSPTRTSQEDGPRAVTSETERTDTPAEVAQPHRAQAGSPNHDVFRALVDQALAAASDFGDGSPAPAEPPASSQTGASMPHAQDSGGSSAAPPPAPGVPTATESMTMSIDDLLSMAVDSPDERLATRTLGSLTPGRATPSASDANLVPTTKLPDLVTTNDLDDERTAIRNTLIERALDVLNVQSEVTFELADLINAAALKAPDSASMRRDIGETLVQSLISLQLDVDFRPAGKKIAAYANLLGLVLQDDEFYQATLDELRSNFSQLLSFIKIFPDQKAEEPSPWIGQVLLVIERVLSEDAQPPKIEWTQPSPDADPKTLPIAVLEDPVLALSDKMDLFDALIEILPRVGKDESLALSVVRALAIITRHRSIAERSAEKKNIQRLFVMVKQLAGSINDRLQSSFMLILRHIVEDDDTTRQIMRSEILQNFEGRPTRPMDTTGYVRLMYHLVIRSPEIFVEITNEKLEIKDYDPSPNPRPQLLSLKPEREDNTKTNGELETPEDKTKNNSSRGEASQTNEPDDTGKASPQKNKAPEIKLPIIDNPSGVIHYILCEIFSYREVEDKDPAATKRKSSEADSLGTSVNGSSESASRSSSSEGLRVSTDTSTPEPGASNDELISKKAEKPDFKAEQHPIYVYRCFLLQCLTELLHSYNRTKVEFINFSRKADPKATTPSKPRSGVLNYLLNDLIPVGTLEHEETLAFRKKATTSHWAHSVVVALCLKTNENGYDKKRDSLDEEDDSELLFVRKFVLEHALKAYRDANASNEALNIKYSRLLCLADLFDRLLQGRLHHISSTHSNTVGTPSQKQIAKLMFEKSFLSALTTSIADVDLNFPQSKRAVKYILRPLKQLTSTAILLSETSSVSTTPGQTDDDEISSASSVSEMDDEREETPDLFRNSTLGMFEPGREEESSSESSGDENEEMYEEEYDDGMEYEEDMERDADEVISDEELEIEGAGPIEGLPGDVGMDVEVVLNGGHVGRHVSQSDEDDEDDDGSEGIQEMDDDDALEAMEEITGDDNDSLAEGDEGEWQDEDELERDEFTGEDEDMGPTNASIEAATDTEAAVQNMMREYGGAEAALQRLHDNGAMDMDMDMEGEAYPDDHMQDEEAVEDEEDEEADEEELMFHGGYADDDQGMYDPPWGLDPDEDSGIPTHRHHHHGRRIVSPWTIFPPGHPSDRGGLIHRSHRATGGPRAADDGTNPLLRRQGRNSAGAASGRSGRPELSEAAASMADFWVHGMDPGPFPRSPLARDSPVSFVSNLIAAIGQGGPTIGAAALGRPLHFTIGGAPGGRAGQIPRELQALLGLRPPPAEATRTSRNESDQTTSFTPQNTGLRWQEEARLLFGTAHAEKAQRIVNSLLAVLVPPAMAKKKREEEEAKLLMEAREKALQEERRIREESEKAEKEAQAKQEREGREQREAAATSDAERQAAPAETEGGGADSEEDGEDDGGAMEGVESTHADESGSEDEGVAEGPTSVEEPGETSSAAPAEERVRTTIRGRELDITGMGVDLEYLEALPEDLREEVLMHQLAEQRSQAVAAGETPSDISREFLEALPPDIREELLQQEAQDRRRREREEERRRRAAENGAPARAEEMDPASFLASLDPGLRQAVLLDQDEEVLNQLPQAIAAEARALGIDRGYNGYRSSHARARMPNQDRDNRESQGNKKAPKKQIVQMLDKAGVATLLRLMFIPQQGSSRQSLNNILHDISQNRQTRAEVISLLLSILQDGSTDVNAVERSFAHLSLRAKQPATQKTPQPLKRSLTGTMPSATNSEMTPLMVVQQCLQCLVFLTQFNPHIPSFFLTEHEVPSGLRSKSGRKGKGKETKAQKFALNALLSLLDRKLIMESPSCMEQLSTLLQAVTHPLTMLLRQSKEKAEKPKETEPSDQLMQDTEATTMVADVQTGESDAQPAGPATVETSTDIPDAAAEAPPVEGPLATDPSVENGPSPAGGKTDEPNKPEDEKTKKQRSLTPPVVPEENLRLVVGILAARECSAKTFRDTLSTINNLSAIPEAKQVFGQGLIEQAQDLGQAISNDLDELVHQIKQAGSGTEIQGMALARFSPASAHQAKLLRVLTALDYLFDPKRNYGKTKSTADEQSPSGEPSTSQEDILTLLYEHPTFGALWTKLSDCLGAIRQGEGMLNIATILLPLIEALMVVCKNTTIKDAPLVKAVKEFSVASPPPESGMENLFFRFTEDHRKILNDLVRHNPKLMSGTFSLLVKNPKVLEFDNKRNYFNRRLHSRGSEARQPQPPLQLNVRRDQVFMDSYKFMHYKSGDEIKYGKLSIRFHGEEGVDAGGVSREWFQVLSRQMFNPDYALFVPVASDRTTFHPNKLSKVNEEHLDFFKFIGRIIGKALYEGRALDCHFSRAVYKRILGKSVSIKDMETLDLDYYKSLLWMLENDITEIITETFSMETDDFGVTEIVDLIENGRNIPVTEENKHEYVQRVVEYRLTGSVQTQLEKFLGGFHDIVSPELIAIFNEQELELLISGLPDIDVDDWKNNSEYHNYSASSSQIVWFWRAVRSFDKEERAKLLQFVTGTSKVPLNGFSQLEGMNGFSRFNIHRDYGNKDRLPSSHTCFNQLDLPEYDSYEQLRQQVYTAMTAGSEYFGFA